MKAYGKNDKPTGPRPEPPAKPLTNVAAVAIIRHTADNKRDDDHADDQLIEEVKIPGWACIAFQTDRPQLLAVATPPGDMDAADVVLLVNLIRVVMETNQSLRQRLARAKEDRDGTRAKLKEQRDALKKILNGG